MTAEPTPVDVFLFGIALFSSLGCGYVLIGAAHLFLCWLSERLGQDESSQRIRRMSLEP